MELRKFAIENPVRLIFGADGQPREFSGYAVVFFDRSKAGTEYIRPYNGGPKDLHTRVLPSAFDETVMGQRVEAWFDHKDNIRLGVTPTSLQLTKDTVGIK